MVKKLIISTISAVILLGVYSTTDITNYVNKSNEYIILGLPYIHT